ncbi:ABC transporter permease [Schwartzia succinivorans]|jgi:Nod factor-specific ABC transporter NodJ protein|uniref:Transport permease protein n=1 Tax=Schwartzia succinivorans DSM 10502 TaxID=1123243 RepID=A0A1M4Z0D9_9FIRM|nr:ABC transporter permease [Schwartzia succinivorans]MBQ3863993.1 ABC transporter permease [Schwartzia sp. (in: firmicutes)]MBQ5414173.1 ABC transporter permease [Schwartzia sp. (in: firmicutes)]SHF11521.1 ABC-2 type transporter, NodJ family [Schwartzia succinivorans DSM 10502]
MLGDIWTVFWRDWVVLKHRMTAFILSRMVAPILYLVAFGWGLGRSIQTAAGGSYLDFLVPGIMALNSMNISFNSVIQVHAEKVYHKSIEEYLTSPIWPHAFVIGKTLAAVLRGLISSAIIICLAYAFGANFTITPLFLLVLVLNCAVFAEIGFAAAMYIKTYEHMGQVNTYALLPMSFLCGTFFSTHTLPDALRWFIELLPLTHTSYLLRGIAMNQEVSLLSVGVLLLYLVIVFVVGSKAFLKLRE